MFAMAWVSGLPIVSLECQMSRSLDVKTSQAAVPVDQACQAPTAHLAYAIVRPTFETWAVERTATYSVGVGIFCYCPL